MLASSSSWEYGLRVVGTWMFLTELLIPVRTSCSGPLGTGMVEVQCTVNL